MRLLLSTTVALWRRWRAVWAAGCYLGMECGGPDAMERTWEAYLEML